MTYVQLPPESTRLSPASLPRWRPPAGAAALRLGAIAALVVAGSLCSVRPALCQPAPPGVDLSKLDAPGHTTFQQITEEQFCPCGKPQSFAATLQAPDGCRAATALGQQLADDLAGGMARRDAVRALLKRVANLNARFDFATDKSPRLGGPGAKVQVVVFSDFECPFCREVSSTLRDLVDNQSDVAIIYKFYPITFHKLAEPAARAAWAAHAQGRFWELHDRIFAHQKELSEELLARLAKEAGLNMDRFRKDMASDAAKAQIEADKAEGDKAGVEGTPTLFVNGLYVDEPSHLKQAIGEARKM